MRFFVSTLRMTMQTPSGKMMGRIRIIMPIVRIGMLQGRTSEVKNELIVRVTDAVVTTLGVDLEHVRVLLYELSPEHWAIGGQMKAMQQSPFAQQQNEADE